MSGKGRKRREGARRRRVMGLIMTIFGSHFLDDAAMENVQARVAFFHQLHGVTGWFQPCGVFSHGGPE
jgi:hypothetical protein